MKSELGLACLIFNTCLKHAFSCHWEIWQFVGEVLCTKDQQWAFPGHTHLEHAMIWTSPFPRAKHNHCNQTQPHLQGTTTMLFFGGYPTRAMLQVETSIQKQVCSSKVIFPSWIKIVQGMFDSSHCQRSWKWLNILELKFSFVGLHLDLAPEILSPVIIKHLKHPLNTRHALHYLIQSSQIPCKVGIISSYKRWNKWSSERVRICSKVTQLVNEKANKVVK